MDDIRPVTDAFSIDPASGGIRVGCRQFRANQSKGEVEPQIAKLVTGSKERRNGHEWLFLRGLSFHGHPSSLSLCFRDERLQEVKWHVELPGAPRHRGWPTREAIDDEVAFVREALARDIGFDPTRKFPQKFDWGVVWSAFDGKAFIASNGIRYRRPSRRWW